MGYSEAFTAAGAVIHDSEYFGSYQGEALFDVTYEGKRGILAIGFGSCGGCDAFESEFGYGDNERADWQERLAAFGRGYLNGVMYGDEVAKYRADLVEQAEWDSDAPAQLRWLDERTRCSACGFHRGYHAEDCDR